jgi:hypothetical protein
MEHVLGRVLVTQGVRLRSEQRLQGWQSAHRTRSRAPLTSSTPSVRLRADVDGRIQTRAYLSGTPECKFGLNDKLVIGNDDRGAGGSDGVELDDC